MMMLHLLFGKVPFSLSDVCLPSSHAGTWLHLPLRLCGCTVLSQLYTDRSLNGFCIFPIANGVVMHIPALLT